MSKTTNRRDATEGETFQLRGQTLMVAAKCSDDAGSWICLEHGALFPHNLGMQGHTDRPGRHVVAWWCWQHGAEVP